MNRTSSSSTFSLPTPAGDDEVETLNLDEQLEPPEAPDSLWTPSKDVRDFQLNIAHTHKKTWKVTGQVQETPVVEKSTETSGATKFKVKHQRKIIWNDEAIRKNNKPLESPMDPLIEKEIQWIKANPDSLTWKRIQDNVQRHHPRKDRKLLEQHENSTVHSTHSHSWSTLLSLKKDDHIDQNKEESVHGSESSSISDAEVYLKHLQDKVSLKILKNAMQSTNNAIKTISPSEETVNDMFSKFLSDSSGMSSVLSEKIICEPNPTNETLRDRTARCIRSVSAMIRDEVIDDMVSSIMKDIQESRRQSMDVLAKGVLRGILDVHEGNKRFLKASGKLLLLRGVIDDFAKNRHDLFHGTTANSIDKIERLTVFNTHELLESLNLKVERERTGGMLSKLLLKDRKNNSNIAWIIRENWEESKKNENSKNEKIAVSSSGEVPYISILHEEGFHDMTKFESQQLKENKHVQDIYVVKMIGKGKPRKKGGIVSSLDIEKGMGKVSAIMTYPDYESKTSIMIVGTTLGRLLCYRIPWKLPDERTTSTPSDGKPTTNSSPQKPHQDRTSNDKNTNSIVSNKDSGKGKGSSVTSNEEPVVQFLASNRKKGKKGDPIDQSEIVSIKCSPAGPSYILTLNKTKRVVLWSLQDLFLPIIDDHKSGTIKQRGIFSCFYCTDNHKRPTIKYIERLGTIDDEELLYRFRMKPLAFELYGKDSLRPKYCQQKMKDAASSDPGNAKVGNKTLIMKVLRAVRTEKFTTLQDHRVPTTVNFFGGLNDRKQLTSLVIGCNDGEIMKINLDFVFTELRGIIKHPRAPFVDKEFINPIQSPANFIVSSSASNSSGSATAVNISPNGGNKVFREIFHWHRSPIVFLETIDKETCMMLSIDEDGMMAKWCYDPERFTGSCWFVPEIVRQLPRTLISYELMDDDKESMQSLNELFQQNKQEQERFQQALHVSKVYYKDISPVSNQVINSPRDKNLRQSARQTPLLSPNPPQEGTTSSAKQMDIKSSKKSPRRSTVINVDGPNSPQVVSDESMNKKLNSEREKKNNRLVQKRFEVTTIYHPVQDEDSDDLVQYEETAKFMLVQPNAQHVGIKEPSADDVVTTIQGVPYVLKKKTVEWTRSFVKKSVDHEGANLILFGRKLTADGLELVHVFRRSHTLVPDMVVSSGNHFVIACLNTRTLEFRFPLTYFSLSNKDHRISSNGSDGHRDEQLLDFDCGPIMAETQTRIVFLLTTKGIRQLGLYTCQEVKVGMNTEVPPESQSCGIKGTIVPKLQVVQSQLAFSASKICVCPSQRSVVLSSDNDTRIEVLLLPHRLDDQRVQVNPEEDDSDHASYKIAQGEKTSPTSFAILESPLKELLNLGGSFSHARLEDCKGLIPPNMLQRFAQRTIIDQEFVKPNAESRDIALNMIDYALELMEDVIDIKYDESMKKSLTRQIFGNSDDMGFISPTMWPPKREGQLDRLLKLRSEDFKRQDVEITNETLN